MSRRAYGNIFGPIWMETTTDLRLTLLQMAQWWWRSGSLMKVISTSRQHKAMPEIDFFRSSGYHISNMPESRRDPNSGELARIKQRLRRFSVGQARFSDIGPLMFIKVDLKPKNFVLVRFLIKFLPTPCLTLQLSSLTPQRRNSSLVFAQQHRSIKADSKPARVFSHLVLTQYRWPRSINRSMFSSLPLIGYCIYRFNQQRRLTWYGRNTWILARLEMERT
jgi:hypothetical protein